MEKQVIQSVGFHNIEENGVVTGFQLKIQPGHLIVDGESFGAEEIM